MHGQQNVKSMTVIHLAPCAVDNYWYIDQVHRWWERHFKTLRKFRFYVISNFKPSLILQIFTQLSYCRLIFHSNAGTAFLRNCNISGESFGRCSGDDLLAKLGLHCSKQVQDPQAAKLPDTEPKLT